MSFVEENLLRTGVDRDVWVALASGLAGHQRGRRAGAFVRRLPGLRFLAYVPGAQGTQPQRQRCSSRHRSRFSEEMQHASIHRWLPVRQRPTCGVGTSIPCGALSLSRLPQASWGLVSCLRRVPRGRGDDRWRNTRLCRTVFLSTLRLVRLLGQCRRDRGELGILGCP